MFKYVVLFSALSLAFMTAIFSVVGISSLYVSAPIVTKIMAAALELAKLVAVSFIYRYWTTLTGFIKYYFLAASVILMCITSFGVYSYLEAAYSGASKEINQQQLIVSSLQSQQQNVKNQISQLTNRQSQVENIRNQQEIRSNQLVGKTGFITQQRLASQESKQLDNIQTQLNRLNNQDDSLSNLIISAQANIVNNKNMGTFAYIAKMLNVQLDTLVKWFTLIIVIVFDPLAVSLVLAYNIIIKNEIVPKVIQNQPILIEEPVLIEQKQPENINLPPGGVRIT